MSVYIDPRLWRRSNYVHPERVVKKCGTCGCRIRGANHENGVHHQQQVKSALVKKTQQPKAA